MNSTELHILAGEAIALWQRDHRGPCWVSYENGNVFCSKITTGAKYSNDPLCISKFEVERGMTQGRWTSIGNALHNQYTKELACQAHQKH